VANIPTVELLESTHSFPGTYTFKVIGVADGGFEARVVAAVREALHFENDPPYSVRESRGGKHQAITLEPTVPEAAAVVAVYERLVTVPGIVMCL
jgi:putative lipoic acid-binding regulatory protein